MNALNINRKSKQQHANKVRQQGKTNSKTFPRLFIQKCSKSVIQDAFFCILLSGTCVNGICCHQTSETRLTLTLCGSFSPQQIYDGILFRNNSPARPCARARVADKSVDWPRKCWTIFQHDEISTQWVVDYHKMCKTISLLLRLLFPMEWKNSSGSAVCDGLRPLQVMLHEFDLRHGLCYGNLVDAGRFCHAIPLQAAAPHCFRVNLCLNYFRRWCDANWLKSLAASLVVWKTVFDERSVFPSVFFLFNILIFRFVSFSSLVMVLCGFSKRKRWTGNSYHSKSPVRSLRLAPQ